MNEKALKQFLATGETPVVAQDESPLPCPTEKKPTELDIVQDEAVRRYLEMDEVAEDEGENPTDLQKHDAKYHPNGYKKGDKCKYREKLDAGDNSDAALAQAEQEEQKDNEIIEDIKTTWNVIPNEDEAREKFLEFARGYVDEGKGKDLFQRLEGFDKFFVVGGRRKNELVLQYFDDKAGYRENPTKNILSWRPKNLPRKKPEPTLKTLMSKISDPFQRQMFGYFNSLININPRYATEPEALVGYLQGYNGERETSDAQVYGPEVQKFFRHIRETPHDEAVKEMDKVMKEYAESPVMARAKKDQTGMNSGRSLDLRQNALLD